MKRYRTPGLLAALLAWSATALASGIAKGPYLMRPTQTSITVCWISDEKTTGTVRYATASDAYKTAGEKAATRFHRVRIAGLMSYTRYRYIVECGGQRDEGTFLTAAPPEQPFKFAAYGDNRTQPNVHAAVLERMMRFDPDFVLNTGDQVANGEIEAQWTEFFAVAGKMLRDAAYYPALGNHERESSLYFNYFVLPRDYSFDYGDAHFVALDTNRPESEQTAQERWLRKDLAEHQNATWRIVFMHHTPCTCVAMEGRRREAERLRARLEPILKAGKVQIVFCGHDHNYQHHVAGGIHYVVTGGGGAPLYDLRPDTPFVKKAVKAHHYCEVRVDGPVMSVRAVEPNGTVIETFEVKANP
jgi:predicted phosphodiesterase